MWYITAHQSSGGSFEKVRQKIDARSQPCEFSFIFFCLMPLCSQEETEGWAVCFFRGVN